MCLFHPPPPWKFPCFSHRSSAKVFCLCSGGRSSQILYLSKSTNIIMLKCSTTSQSALFKNLLSYKVKVQKYYQLNVLNVSEVKVIVLEKCPATDLTLFIIY